MNIKNVNLSTAPHDYRLTESEVQRNVNAAQEISMPGFPAIRDTLRERRDQALLLVADDVKTLATRLNILKMNVDAAGDLDDLRERIEGDESWSIKTLTDIVEPMLQKGRASRIVRDFAEVVTKDVAFLVHTDQYVAYLDRLLR